VESKRGSVGGYLLAREPSQIKLGDVLRFIDGPLEPVACVEKNYSGCQDKYRCVFRSIWQEVADATSRIVDNVTFEDLAHNSKNRHQEVSYAI